MDKKPGNQSEAGSITLIAIIVMVAFGILLAGLLPFITHTGVSAAYSVRSLQAHYAAEAGAKRAIVGLAQGSGNWGWLGNEVNLTDNAILNARYQVSVTSETGVTLTGTPAAGTYKVTSVGSYGRSTKTVTVQVDIATGTLPDLTAGLCIGGKISRDSSVTSNIQIDGNVPVRVSGSVTDVSFSANVKDHKENLRFSIPPIDGTKVMNGAVPLSLKLGSTNALTSGKTYYTSTGGLTLQGSSAQNTNIQCNGDGFAVIYVRGNLTLDFGGGNFQNIVFIIDGDLIVKNCPSFSGNLFYCNNANFSSSASDFSSQLVTRGNLVLGSSRGNINKYNGQGVSDYLATVLTNGSSYKVSNWAAQ
jgi:hypothetical protein